MDNSVARIDELIDTVVVFDVELGEQRAEPCLSWTVEDVTGDVRGVFGELSPRRVFLSRVDKGLPDRLSGRLFDVLLDRSFG